MNGRRRAAVTALLVATLAGGCAQPPGPATTSKPLTTPGQVPEASRPATWPTSHTSPPTITTVPMVTSCEGTLSMSM